MRAEAAAALPAGYVAERVGPVRWTYPSAAREETQELQAHRAAAWASVLAELGAEIDAQLDIRVARNPEEMQKLAPSGVTLPGYADGIAFPARGLILLTLTEPRTFLRPDMKRVLTHELSHVALHRAIGGAAVPHWFTEGVAIHQAGEHSLGRMRTLWEGTLRGKLMPLDHLTHGFPTAHDEVDLAYAQSADFIRFMMSSGGGPARFRQLLTGLAAQEAFPDAVKRAYQLHVGYLEHTWRQTLTQRFGRWPALLMGLTFVWVLAAVLLGVAYVRSRRKHKATLRRWAIEEAPLAEGLVTMPPAPPASTPAQSHIEEFFERARVKSDAGVPTVVHDGQAHTLH